MNYRFLQQKLDLETREPIGETWWEESETDMTDAEEAAQKLMDNFNKTCHPGENNRHILKVEVLDATLGTSKHKWKKTNLVTIMGCGILGGYDTMQCENCGITGRRYGLGQNGVTMDRRWKAKVYQDCRKAKKHMEKRGIY